MTMARTPDVIEYGTKELITGICIGVVIGFLLCLFLA